MPGTLYCNLSQLLYHALLYTKQREWTFLFLLHRNMLCVHFLTSEHLCHLGCFVKARIMAYAPGALKA